MLRQDSGERRGGWREHAQRVIDADAFMDAQAFRVARADPRRVVEAGEIADRQPSRDEQLVGRFACFGGIFSGIAVFAICFWQYGLGVLPSLGIGILAFTCGGLLAVIALFVHWLRSDSQDHRQPTELHGGIGMS